MAFDACSTAAPSRRALLTLTSSVALAAGIPGSSAAVPPYRWAAEEAQLAKLHTEWWRRVEISNGRQEAAHDAWQAEGALSGTSDAGYRRLSELELAHGVHADDADFGAIGSQEAEITQRILASGDVAPDTLRMRVIISVLNHHGIDADQVELLDLLLFLAELTGVAGLPWLAEEVACIRHELARHHRDGSHNSLQLPATCENGHA